MVTLSNIRLLATDIDGTLLNPEFKISDGDLPYGGRTRRGSRSCW
jgi:3-deoxy-D-manno-octulosonate 8-phosphate phosphatase KdsC-like HAD superfamily phosphatase